MYLSRRQLEQMDLPIGSPNDAVKGKHRKYYGGGGKGDSPDAPDYSQIAAANEQAAKYAKESADADLAFRKDVYKDSLPRQNQLYDLASQVAQQQLGLGNLTQQQAEQQDASYNATYRPIELQTVLDSLGSQYLSEDDVKQAIQYLTNPEYDESPIMSKRQKATTTYTPETIETTQTEDGTYTPTGLQGGNVYDYNRNFTGKGQQAYQPVAAPKTTKTTTTTQKPTTTYTDEEFQSGVKRVLNKDYEAKRALGIDTLSKKAQEGAAREAGEKTQAQVNSATDQQTRALARMGLNPARFQAVAAETAQRQALTNVNAQNNARTETANKQLGLRTGVANFGRNMPNTVGQAVAGSTNAGSAAVGNQSTGFNSGLPYAQFASGGTAAQLQAAQLKQQGALGLGGLMNQGYQIGSQNSGGDFLGGALGLAGSIGSSLIMSGSDRSIKENIVKVGEHSPGIFLYNFEYKPEYKDQWGHGGFIGVMADEVEKVIPEAVETHPDGYQMVNYEMLGL